MACDVDDMPVPFFPSTATFLPGDNLFDPLASSAALLPRESSF